jgi:hypothetical protein
MMLPDEIAKGLAGVWQIASWAIILHGQMQLGTLTGQPHTDRSAWCMFHHIVKRLIENTAKRKSGDF